MAVAGKPEDSPIYTLPAHLEDPKMPPNAPKIPQREIDVLRRWVEGGLIERAGDSAIDRRRRRHPKPRRRPWSLPRSRRAAVPSAPSL